MAGRSRSGFAHVWKGLPRQRLVRPRPGVAIIAASFAALLAGCSGGSPQAAQAPASPRNVMLTRDQQQRLHVVTVEPSSYHASIATTAVVDFDHDHATDVLAPFSGPVTRVLVTLGDHVQQGQALADVASPDFTSAVGAYRKALVIARAADRVAANDRDLVAHQAISERENAQAQADAIGADADRDAARQALVALHVDPASIADLAAGRPLAHPAGVIRAPIAGTVVAKSIAPGQTLAAGTTACFTIADTSTMWVMAQLFGADAGSTRPGDAAAIDPGDGGKAIDGKVARVGAVVDPDTRSVTARIAVDNPAGALRKGMYVQVRIESQDARTGLLVPVSAVLRDDENLPFVYVVAPDGSYARRPVTLGVRVDDRYVIPDGLRAGDRVVVDGSIFLRFIQTQ